MYFVKQMCIDYANFGACNIFLDRELWASLETNLFFLESLIFVD